jgi:hypothetical protein
VNPVQKSAFENEMAAARACLAQQDLSTAQHHLERAHVIGQAHVLPHVRSHGLMLRLEWRRRRWAAVMGQALRIVLGAAGSAVGVVPTGNTGGSDINMFRRLPVAPELQRAIDGESPDRAANNPDFEKKREQP